MDSYTAAMNDEFGVDFDGQYDVDLEAMAVDGLLDMLNDEPGV